MKKIASMFVLIVLITGCARFSTTQKEIRFDDRTEITTKATAYTLFESKSALTDWKAVQSDGEQSAEVGSLNQETSAGTNIVAALDGILRIVQAVK